MSAGTSIEWATHTMNLWWGCTRVSPGCEHCYAESLDARYHPSDRHWGPSAGRLLASEATWRAPFRWDAAAAASGERARVFSLSMGDWAEAWKRAELRPAVARLFATIALTPNLDWLLLTKRPADALELLHWGPFDAMVMEWADRLRAGPSSSAAAREGWKPLPGWTRERIARIGVSRVLAGAAWWPHVWHGVTVEDQKRADERIPLLLKFDARVRWLSCEPLLERVSIRGASLGFAVDRPAHCAKCDRGHGFGRCPNYGSIAKIRTGDDGKTIACDGFVPKNGISWVVIGGESGPKARPVDLAWIQQLVGEARDIGAKPFVKQIGAKPVAGATGWRGTGYNPIEEPTFPVKVRGSGGDPEQWPVGLRIREFPEPARVIA